MPRNSRRAVPLPLVLDVLDFEYEVKMAGRESADSREAYAWIKFDPPCIYIQEGLPPSVQCAVFFHEVCHAVHYSARGLAVPLDDIQREEYYTHIIATGLITVLKRNPKLLAYLNDNLQ